MSAPRKDFPTLSNTNKAKLAALWDAKVVYLNGPYGKNMVTVGICMASPVLAPWFAKLFGLNVYTHEYGADRVLKLSTGKVMLHGGTVTVTRLTGYLRVCRFLEAIYPYSADPSFIVASWDRIREPAAARQIFIDFSRMET